ncbi:MAG: OmpA family protein [Cyclobacteriaceae bacterium]|nr:OmpA family protein [Cyclobacteriaceae bacterium]
MKTLKLYALVGIFSTISIVLPARVEYGKDQINATQPPNYVVIGAFSIQRNAIKFTNHASKMKLPARFEMNPSRNLYYVYVLSTEDREAAIQEALKLRSETEFFDTWVYSGMLGKVVEGVEITKGVDINPMTERNMESVPLENNATGKLVASTNPTVASVNEATPSLEVPKPKAETNEKGTEIEGKKFFFKIFRSVDSEAVEGDVDIVDNEKSRKMGTYKGNTAVTVPVPGNKAGEVSLICEVFGYRKLQRDVNYNSPVTENVSVDADGNVVVPFELVRLQKGDIAVMYNVYFFKDAGIMRPESRFEVNSLLEMLQENPKYKIRIHGHTNGGAHGKIISMDKNSKNYFALQNTNEGVGSAKKLSEERASVIRNYLLSNGIEPGRMQVKAWGGKRPIHEKHSTRANENVRVEIEILEN